MACEDNRVILNVDRRCRCRFPEVEPKPSRSLITVDGNIFCKSNTHSWMRGISHELLITSIATTRKLFALPYRRVKDSTLRVEGAA